MNPKMLWCEIHGPVCPTATKQEGDLTICRIYTGHNGEFGSTPYCGEHLRLATLDEIAPFALDWLDRSIARSRAPVIYVHDVRGKLGEGAIIAAVIPEGDLLQAASIGMEGAGWNAYDHDHLDGSDS